MYIPFNAPVGAGGQAEPFTPSPALSFDSAGNPLPLQSNPAAAALPANPWTAAATSSGGAASLLAASSPSPVGALSPAGGVPVVLPWVDYGGGVAGGSGGSQTTPWQGPSDGSYGFAHYAFYGGSGGSNGEPPWSDALAGGGCGCHRSSLWDLIKAHPWITLGIVVAVVAVVNESGK